MARTTHADGAGLVQNASMTNERRACGRESLELPISLPGGQLALTRDVSPQGMYFLVAAGTQLDHWVSLSYALPYAHLKFVAAAEVVRVEPGAQFTGIAVRLHDTKLLPVQED